MAKERLQKILARAGLASSRRKAEELILEGSITINGKSAKLGDSAEMGKDAIKVRGKLIHTIDENHYYAFYKPRGTIAAFSDPENRPTIAPYLADFKQRLFAVERLEFNADGLILLTNDGALQERLQKQSAKVPRVYHVKIRGHIDAELFSRLERGAKIEERFVKPKFVRQFDELAKKSIIEIVFLGVPGGLDLRAYFEAKGFLVERVTRVGIGTITLRGLAPGQMREIEKTAVDSLFDQPELLFKKFEHEERLARAKGRDPRGLKPEPRAPQPGSYAAAAASLKLPTPLKPGERRPATKKSSGKRPSGAKGTWTGVGKTAGPRGPDRRPGAAPTSSSKPRSRLPSLFEGSKSRSPSASGGGGARTGMRVRKRGE